MPCSVLDRVITTKDVGHRDRAHGVATGHIHAKVTECNQVHPAHVSVCLDDVTEGNLAGRPLAPGFLGRFLLAVVVTWLYTEADEAVRCGERSEAER